MAKLRLSSNDIRHIVELRYADETLSCRYIAQQVGVGATSVHKVLSSAYGLYLEAIHAGKDVTDATLMQWVYPCSTHSSNPDWARVHYELKSGMTRKQLYGELETPYRYSRFCKLYNEWLASKPAKSTVHCFPAHTCVVQAIECSLFGHRSQRISVFVGLLPASNYLYLDAYKHNGSPFEWFDCMSRLFAHLGGVPRQVVIPPIDGVEDYQLLEHALGTKVIVNTPKERWSGPGCELASGALGWVTRQSTVYHKSQLALMKVRLQTLAADWNSGGLDYYPSEPTQWAFEKIDRYRLNTRPKSSSAFTHHRTVKVRISSHIKYGVVFYSVPCTLIGHAVEVVASLDRVQVYHSQRLVADHPRLTNELYQTEPSHMATCGAKGLGEWSPKRFMSWAHGIGPNTAKWVRIRLSRGKYPEHGYESCSWLLSMAKTHGPEKMEHACGRWGQRTMGDIKKMLEKNGRAG